MAKSLDELKAEFAARGGQVTVAATGMAYGVSAEADRIKREAERDRLEAERSMQECEQHAERVREAYHVGGRSAAIGAMNAPSRRVY